MSSINLTHAEAIQRSHLLRVHNYSFAIDITGESAFPSKTTVRFEVLEAGSTFIDLLARDVHHVSIDGADITDTAVPRKDGVYDQAAGIQLNNLTPGEHELVVEATCEYSHTGQGLHRFVDPVDSEVYFYTQFETADAKRVFACFDQPDLKATYDIAVQAPSHWKVVTNAPQLVKADGEKAVFSSRVDYPLSTYLVAICAGDFAVVSDLWSGKLTHHPETPADQPTELEIPLGIYCRKSLAEHLDADTIFRETKQGFDFYHEHFGMAYPFGKYDQLFVPDFNAGAMENAGAVTFRDEYVFTSKHTRYAYERRCDTILHEMAHMWFGDLVTMKWWDDLWLNESFATWGAAISQAEATEYDSAWVTFANVEKSWAYQQDQLPSTHPISTDASDIETVEQNFDGITYAKGASVLKQLQAYVGRDAFFAGVRKHFAVHAYGNATFDDLLAALEESSGRDLSHWANQWLKTTGINELACEFEVVDGVYSSFAITQSGAAPGDGELRTHRTCVGLYSLIDGMVTRTHSIEVDVDSACTVIPELIGVAAADLVLPNDFDLTYCQMKLDANSLAFAVEHIDKIADPMARTLCWSAAWEMTRNGEMRARDFIALVARGARFETEIAVLQRILSQATQARKMFADPTWVEETGAQLLLHALLEGARSAEPGSDFQLAFVQELGRNLVEAGKSTDLQAPEVAAIKLFKGIVAGTSSLEGLDADNDLRWNALISLAAVDNSFDVEKEISVLSKRDPSSQGKAFSERARAAVNTATNKARVFTELTEQGKGLSNTIFRAKMAGLTGFARPELLEQLNERYFEMVVPMWKSFTSEIAQDAIAGLFPRWSISDSTVDRTQRFLDQEDLPGGVRRLISEAQADVIRAVRNRCVDAGACSGE